MKKYILLIIILLGLYFTYNLFSFVEQATQSQVVCPKGFHLMPDGNCMLDSEM